jgi:hypothetical protein
VVGVDPHHPPGSGASGDPTVLVPLVEDLICSAPIDQQGVEMPLSEILSRVETSTARCECTTTTSQGTHWISGETGR